MDVLEVAGKKIEVDEDGFIQEPDKWDQDVARALAQSEGVDELGDGHWKLVHYLRDHYQKFGVAPMIRKLCRDTGFKLVEIYSSSPRARPRGRARLQDSRNRRAACDGVRARRTMKCGGPTRGAP